MKRGIAEQVLTSQVSVASSAILCPGIKLVLAAILVKQLWKKSNLVLRMTSYCWHVGRKFLSQQCVCAATNWIKKQDASNEGLSRR